MRGPAVRFAGFRVFIRGEHVDRGLVRPERGLGGQRGLHCRIEPGIVQPVIEPAGGFVHEPGRHRDAEQHADQVRGPFGGYVPVPGQQHRGRVDPWTVGDAARVRAGRGVRGGDLPAARAPPCGQQVLGGEPADLHVPDLRPGPAAGSASASPVPHREHRAGGSAL